MKTTSTVFDILEILREQDGAQITTVAEELDLAVSTAYRHLTTLAEEGYVIKEDNEYYPGMRFLRFGRYVRDRKQIYQLAKPKITELAEKTEERAEFMVEEYGRSVFVHRDTGDNAVQTDSGIGKFHPLHATAAGKSILAFLPEERVNEICETRGLEAFTDNTITDKETLFAELETIRERGVGYNDQEYINGLRAVGVPVKDVDESIVGAISVSGPTHRLKGEWYEEEIPDMLLGMTNEIELKISYPEDGS
ncbi:IclR family transcriptional regulator [Salinibaculum salinum]|uniref:IclR family transcriptional regulator n=1 Tax=Salinibaculum salinum TaxID=3131996 RepID=UPI0030EB314B